MKRDIVIAHQEIIIDLDGLQPRLDDSERLAIRLPVGPYTIETPLSPALEEIALAQGWTATQIAQLAEMTRNLFNHETLIMQLRRRMR